MTAGEGGGDRRPRTTAADLQCCREVSPRDTNASISLLLRPTRLIIAQKFWLCYRFWLYIIYITCNNVLSSQRCNYNTYIYMLFHRRSYIVIWNSWAKHGSASFHSILIFMTSSFFFSSIPDPFNLFRFISFSFCPQQSRRLGGRNEQRFFARNRFYSQNVTRDVRRRGRRGSCI